MEIKRKYNTRAKYCKINELQTLVTHAERIGIPITVFENVLPETYFAIVTDMIYRNTIKTIKELALFDDVSTGLAEVRLKETVKLYRKTLFRAIMCVCNARGISNIDLSSYRFLGFNLGWEPRVKMGYLSTQCIDRPIGEQEFEIEEFYLHLFKTYQIEEELQEVHDLRNIAESIHFQMEVN